MPRVRPLPGWIAVRPRPAFDRDVAGVIIVADADKGETSEGVAEVVALGSCCSADASVPTPIPLQIGDLVLYRGFLRFAQPIGDRIEERGIFMLQIGDVLAVVDVSDGGGTVGPGGKYRV
jgi:co-chaperonin GroES (HSP10)